MVDVIIPVYRPDETFRLLLQKLQEQTFVVHKVIIANTEAGLWDEFVKKAYGSMENLEGEWKKFSFDVELFHVKKEEFNHGGTRRKAVECSKAEYFVCMTQDAMPKDSCLIENLLKPLQEDEMVAAAYARQLPNSDCNVLEAYTRSFNYPDTDGVKTKEDLNRLGIKTFFCSNVCALYNRKIWEEVGGFVDTMFNEDMICAGHAINAGYKIAYAAKAKVVHSHNLTGRQQYARNFDLAVSQAKHPEVFEGIKSESEGIRMVKSTMKHLFEIKKPWLILQLVWQSGCKYLGYRAGLKYGKKHKMLK